MIQAAIEANPNTVRAASQLQQELARFFCVRFSIWDASGEQLCSGDHPQLNERLRGAVPQAAAHTTPQLLLETEAVVLLALPIETAERARLVAVALLRKDTDTRADGEAKDHFHFDVTDDEWIEWNRRQTPWRRNQLWALAEAVVEKITTQTRTSRREEEVSRLSQNLVSTYEEISLLYTITQNLRISRSDEEIGELALERLFECVPADGFAIYYLASPESSNEYHKGRRDNLLIPSGQCPIDADAFDALIAHLDLQQDLTPCVRNRRLTARSDWPFPRIRQLVIVPLAEGNNLFGWLAAFNHCEEKEFGTVEANLLLSLGALLGIHSSNRDLYRQQAEFLANVVRALVSAIDAKDRYTSGHSDRVARVAVRLALELRCDPKVINTIYMAGLLHDVGKIGIDDQVLRKAGRLTDAEFEHIKMHPELGYKILGDLTQLSDVLPAVLHHHERWDGHGYPQGIAGDEIPRIARIMAVADAYDAMTSDRPYRAGMPEEKVDDIFRQGSGSHWDPQVVAAYFAAKADILEIVQRERSTVLDLEQELV